MFLIQISLQKSFQAIDGTAFTPEENNFYRDYTRIVGDITVTFDDSKNGTKEGAMGTRLKYKGADVQAAFAFEVKKNLSKISSDYLKDEFNKIIGNKLDKILYPSEISSELAEKCKKFCSLMDEEADRLYFKRDEIAMNITRAEIKQDAYREGVEKYEERERKFSSFLEHYKSDVSPGDRFFITPEEFKKLKEDAKSLALEIDVIDKGHLEVHSGNKNTSYYKFKLDEAIPEVITAEGLFNIPPQKSIVENKIEGNDKPSGVVVEKTIEPEPQKTQANTITKNQSFSNVKDWKSFCDMVKSMGSLDAGEQEIINRKIDEINRKGKKGPDLIKQLKFDQAIEYYITTNPYLEESPSINAPIEKVRQH